MNIEPNWNEIYSILGVTSEDNWDSVKNAYRSLAQANHPDRFPEDSEARASAESKFININNAYQEIAKYYRKHNHLPGQRFQPFARKLEENSRPSSSNTESAQFSSRRSFQRASGSKRRLKTGFKIAFMFASVYFAYGILFESPEVNFEAPPEESVNNIAAQKFGADNSLSNRDNSFFTPGSTMGEVIAAQGVPTHTEGNTWYYGSSRITFENGVVKSWNDSIDNPLRIRPADPVLGNRTAHSRLTSRFTYGSTKADVLALQGKPINMSDTVWDYGFAKVYFENGRVVKWTDSPLLPLKVEKPPH